RDRAIAQVAARLVDQPLVAIIGPSGSGKSSFVRAGVIPALKRGGDAWEAFVLRPGPRPLVALADLLMHHSWTQSTDAIDSVIESTSSDSLSPHAERDQVCNRLIAEPGHFGA